MSLSTNEELAKPTMQIAHRCDSQLSRPQSLTTSSYSDKGGLVVSDEYERVCESIADELFGSDHAGRPVYAFADSETLMRVIVAAGLNENDPEKAIVRVVRSSLVIDNPGVAPFRWQTQAAQRHIRQPLETPFALPLLLILTLAAARMKADDDVAPHNYYSRLCQLLRVPKERYSRVQQDYRQHASELWGSLNTWLEAWEGERGIPTAYSVGGHEFIGLPLSQVVVRQYDRNGLHEFFACEGMTPGMRLSPEDMESAIDPYATVTPSLLSSHLRGLWKVQATRERIVDAACLELEVWDGIEQERIGTTLGVVTTRLLAFLRRFPRKSIEFSLLLPYRSEGPDIAKFDLSEGEVSVPTSVGPSSSTRLSSIEGVSAASLVGELLVGKLGNGEGRPFTRRPKRVVPLRWDDIHGAYIEAERMSLGEDGLILAKADTRRRVELHLTAHARPGWCEVSSLSGMPEGWILYEHVQILSAPTEQPHVDLLPLIPRARTSLTLRGGFVLPGLLRKWSSLEPPEIVALAARASTVTVRVYRGTRIDPDALLLEETQNSELNVMSLSDHLHVDGEYLVAMFVDGASHPSSTALLRLRSAATPQFSANETDIQLVYSPDAAVTWPLTAGSTGSDRCVNGARVVGLSGSPFHDGSPIREFIPRERPRIETAQRQTRIGIALPEDSCLVTGMHRFMLPTYISGQPQKRTLQGECETCGLVRRFAGTPWAARRRQDPTQSNHIVDIPPITESSGPDFQIAFDAISHIGHGSFATFERIAAQVEGSGLFADAFLRRQEVMGHIDVALDEWFQVTGWAVNSATLVPIAIGRWVLIGSQSRALIDHLRRLLKDKAKVIESVDKELARVEIVGELVDEATLSEVGVSVLEQSSTPVIAAVLPNLSEVAGGLKRIAVPGYRSIEFWDTTSASWQPTNSLGTPGAYRLKDFRSIYIVRSTDDINEGLVRIGTAQLVKHIASLWARDPLVGYHSRSGSVVVPLGADLPGLYGRTLSLCSGKAPREIVKHRMLQYPEVPRDIANLIFSRLTQ